MSSDKETIRIIDDFVNGKPLEEVEEIQIANIPYVSLGEEFRDKILSYPNLLILSFACTELSNIDNLPALPRLLRLELCYCRFPLQNLQSLVWKFPNLVSLRLVGCNITSIKQIECLTGLSDLTQLDLVDNELQKNSPNQEVFHDSIFKLIPKIVYLDNLKKEWIKPCTIPEKQINLSQLSWDINLTTLQNQRSKSAGAPQFQDSSLRKNKKPNEQPNEDQQIYTEENKDQMNNLNYERHGKIGMQNSRN